MNGFYQEALGILEGFPESEYRASLSALVSYTIERKK
ncbi:MAG TPA: polyprenyl synthetase, partial [Algoriphagus sp.]|nr:polyprenyl synthetase [Algoriphagus sp.]